MPGTTTRLGFPYPLGTDPIKEGAEEIQDLAEAADTANLVRSYGKSIIATEQSRTNAAYGTMATPDEVEITLPESGLIAVAYQATWEESNSELGRAAIFVGSSQLKIANALSGAPQTQAAVVAAAPGPNIFRPLVTTSFGLLSSYAVSTAYTGDVTTGQAIGIAAAGLENHIYYQELGGAVGRIYPESPGGAFGGPCYIFAAAGTYAISVRFKASAGSVTVKNRKLWVWSMF